MASSDALSAHVVGTQVGVSMRNNARRIGTRVVVRRVFQFSFQDVICEVHSDKESELRKLRFFVSDGGFLPAAWRAKASDALPGWFFY